MTCGDLECAVKACNKEKGHAQIALSYTLGDAYTLDYWTNIAKEIENMGADSICIKDMAGLLLPYEATELISRDEERDETAYPAPYALYVRRCKYDVFKGS